ncbi:MAG: phytanoyl-CoA dioxygenase family protein [Planctomycetes bacterium]|nr:phytanoyl-CoA dioxygenase family protein [Planctomycetota bacterium]
MLVDLRKQYLETGCIFVPGLLTPAQVERMRLIGEHVLSQWRVRSPEDGKAGIDQPGAIVLRHLNHPGYYAGRREWLVELLDLIADPRVLGVVREIFDDEVVFRCTSLFFNPLTNSREGNWHRDSQFGTPDPLREREQVERSAEVIRTTRSVGGVQMQVALVPTEDSEYVPGSHLRWDTPEENYIRLAEGQKYSGSSLMPGAVKTHQEPGDAAAFHAFGLHRGRYHTDKCRRTLMLTYNPVGSTTTPDYFNDQPWCLEPGYLDGVKPETKEFFERFIERFRGSWKKG